MTLDDPTPDDLTLDLTDAPDREDRAVVGRGILAGNTARHGDDHRDLCLFLRDGAGTIRAGLVGETLWRWLHVELLWVEEGLRGQGWGSRLLAEAEREATARGCVGVRLDTLSTQAPGFYLAHGYRRVGAVEGFPPGHALIYLAKDLTAGPDSLDAPDAPDAPDAEV